MNPGRDVADVSIKHKTKPLNELRRDKAIFHTVLLTTLRPWQSLFSLFPLLTWLWSTSPFRHSSWVAKGERRQRSGCSSRQVTPHLGYLTNWHSLIQSVKFSLSNTLSGGPDHQRRLCEGGEDKKRRYTNTAQNVRDQITNITDKVSDFSKRSPGLPSNVLPRQRSQCRMCRQLERGIRLYLSQWWHCAQDGSVWPLSFGTAKGKSKQGR